MTCCVGMGLNDDKGLPTMASCYPICIASRKCRCDRGNGDGCVNLHVHLGNWQYALLFPHQLNSNILSDTIPPSHTFVYFPIQIPIRYAWGGYPAISISTYRKYHPCCSYRNSIKANICAVRIQTTLWPIVNLFAHQQQASGLTLWRSLLPNHITLLIISGNKNKVKSVEYSTRKCAYIDSGLLQSPTTITQKALPGNNLRLGRPPTPTHIFSMILEAIRPK